KPASPSARIATIWLSEYFDFLIPFPLKTEQETLLSTCSKKREVYGCIFSKRLTIIYHHEINSAPEEKEFACDTDL
ncbi:MAG: hypothetical protein ACKOC1_00290, partial [Hyphomicrobiales bacterium]